MAHSRPPPVRTHTAGVSPPPLSPRTHSDKKHHSRKKSGKDHVVAEKKSSRPATLSRRTTPSHLPRLGPSRRDRERDEDDRRDSGESFPQFCMSCEKQFVPANNTFLYCSEACRTHDQAPMSTLPSRNSYIGTYTPTSPPLSPYMRPAYDDGPDIVPRFSPTQPRPRSYFNSDPKPLAYQPPQASYHTPSNSDDRTKRVQGVGHRSSTALASLRELATALPKTSRRSEPESPPSSISRRGSAVWNYIPFTSSGTKTTSPTPSATPGNSWTNTYASQSYSGREEQGSREDLYGYGKSYGASGYTVGYSTTGGMGMDRPLPPRSGPGGYGHRPKSIDLVTPYSGQQ